MHVFLRNACQKGAEGWRQALLFVWYIFLTNVTLHFAEAVAIMNKDYEIVR